VGESSHMIREKIISPRGREAVANRAADVDLQTVVSKASGATSFSTGIARFQPGALLPYHVHQIQ
jgi:hypothetical protein